MDPASAPRPVGPGSAGSADPARNSVASPAGRARLRRATRDFESMLVENMLKTARTSSPAQGLGKAMPGRDIYQGLTDEQFARAVTQGRGLGLGEMLYQGLLRSQPTKPSSAGGQSPIQGHRETRRDGRAAL
jgi:flagellar protein FlgJ